MAATLVALDTRGLGFSPQTLQVSDAVVNALGATNTYGVVAGSGAVASEGIALTKRTEITLTAREITMTDAGAAGSHGGTKIYDFPVGLISIRSAVTDLTITAGSGGITDTSAVVGAVGTTVTATDNATLTGTEANIVPTTDCTLVDGAGVMDGENLVPISIDGTGGALDMYLNFATVDAGSTANDTLTVTGTVIVEWALVGDN